jgi:transposase
LLPQKKKKLIQLLEMVAERLNQQWHSLVIRRDEQQEEAARVLLLAWVIEFQRYCRFRFAMEGNKMTHFQRPVKKKQQQQEKKKTQVYNEWTKKEEGVETQKRRRAQKSQKDQGTKRKEMKTRK